MPSVNDFANLGGWVDSPSDVEKIVSSLPIPLFSSIAGIAGSGKGEIVLLYKNVEKVVGKFETFLQTAPDCVSNSSAQAINVLACTEIIHGDLEIWQESCATEPIYGNSRILVGRGQLGTGGGSINAWACEAMQKYGFNVRKKYGPGDLDLTVYSGKKAELFGNRGTPKELLEASKIYVVKNFTQVKRYEEARDAICSGYPVIVASNVGFNNVRDKNGCLRRQGSWAHSMLFCGVDDSKDPALFCQNSWGPGWVSGSKRFESDPEGGFWVRANDANIMLAANDSFALSALNGFPVRKLDVRKWG